MNEKDLKDLMVGDLIVIEKHGKSNNGNLWRCKCACGKETIVLSSNLIKGHTKSCGCRRVGVLVRMNKKHGLANHKLFGIWIGMKTRCYNDKCDMYYAYGYRGIKVCNEWLYNFEIFYNWAINNGYKEGLSIDRIDVNGDYSPDNCKFSTYIEQARNKRTSLRFEFQNNTKTLKEWCAIYGIKYHLAYNRLRFGWSFNEALEIAKQ